MLNKNEKTEWEVYVWNNIFYVFPRHALINVMGKCDLTLSKIYVDIIKHLRDGLEEMKEIINVYLNENNFVIPHVKIQNSSFLNGVEIVWKEMFCEALNIFSKYEIIKAIKRWGFLHPYKIYAMKLCNIDI